MKRTFFIQINIVIFLAAMSFEGCKKEVQDPHPEIDVNYTTEIDGYKVTFTNKTVGGVSYKWDFGDGAISTEQSPVHTYGSKGKFVPTLYVTTQSGKILEGSTVLRISKTSPVKLNDNSFDDWATVTKNNYTMTAAGNAVKKAKFDYDATSVYFYVEMQRKLADNDIFDMYLDTDGLPTGYDIAGYFTGAGIDALIEGQILGGADAWADVYYYKGPGWAWDGPMAITGAYQIGTVKEEGGLLKFEGKFDRTKLKGLTGTAMKLGFIVTKNDWSAEVGYLPDAHSPAVFIDMSE